MVYFDTHALGMQSGVMITGSNKSPNFNGSKMVLVGETIYGYTIQALYQAILKK